MSAKGVVYLIDINKFTDSEDVRPNAKDEINKLIALWNSFGLEVEQKENLSKKELMDCLGVFTKDERHRTADYCVLLFVSPPELAKRRGYVETSDRGELNIGDIEKQLHSSTINVAIPKLLYFFGYNSSTFRPQQRRSSFADGGIVREVQDIYTVYFSPIGEESHLSEFIDLFCDEMMKGARNDQTLNDISNSISRRSRDFDYCVNPVTKGFNDTGFYFIKHNL